MPVSIRAARPEDIPDILDMGRDLNAHVRAPAPDQTEARFLADGFGEGRRFTALVADADEALAGYVVYMPAYDYDRASRGHFVHDLYVRPDWRRRGVARALLSEVARATRNDGGDFVWWVSFRLNREARGFYRGIARELRDLDVWKLDDAALRRLAEG
ncbi:MAG: GNAT family N-acetyltransferase [Acetobacterales bacterium]